MRSTQNLWTLHFTALTALVLHAPTEAWGTAIQWTNTLGGDWYDVTGWSPNQVPGTNDDAFITADGTYTVTVSGPTPMAVSGLTIGGGTGTQTLFAKDLSTLWLEGPRFTTYGILRIATNGVLLSDRVAFEWRNSVIVEGTLTATNECGLLASGPVDFRPGARATFDHIFRNSAGNVNAVWNNSGTITLQRSVDLPRYVTNAPSGVIEVGGETSITSRSFGWIYNYGVFRKATGTNITNIGLNSIVDFVRFVNRGIFDLHSGGVYVPWELEQLRGVTLLNGGTLKVGFFSSFRNVNFRDGLFQGWGSIEADVVNNGTFSPGPAERELKIDGAYTQTSRGALNIEIGGLIPGSDFDVLSVSSNATLSGAINICPARGFIPNVGDRFEILRAASIEGAPIQWVGLDIAKGRRLIPVFTGTNITLVAVDAPTDQAPWVNIMREYPSWVVCWPLGYEGFQLESNRELGPPNWLRIGPADEHHYAFDPTESAKFFRLAKP